MGLFNPAWFRQLADNACELLFGDDEVEQPQPAFNATPPDSRFCADDPVLVAWASQTGTAEAFSDEAIRWLHASGLSAVDMPFDTLELAVLESASQALFIVSTSYDGDPPDMAEAFSDTVMKQPADLQQLRYGLLALGDRCYADFCGFGHQLHDWLQASHARAWFDPVEVDDEDPAALQCWRDRVGALLTATSD